jgi:hypothetical protein
MHTCAHIMHDTYMICKLQILLLRKLSCHVQEDASMPASLDDVKVSSSFHIKISVQ